MDPSVDAEPGRDDRRRRLPIWLPRALGESFLIVLSVLLALALDEWRDQRARSARVDMAVESIAAELRQNAAIVERARLNHLAMRDSLLVYQARGEPPPARVYLGGLFNPALVHATAWESARELGTTADMPYELVLELSGMYDQQARYRTLAAGLVQEIMTRMFRDGEEAVFRDRSTSFISLQQDFANRESSLHAAYGYVLERLAMGPGAFRSVIPSAGRSPH